MTAPYAGPGPLGGEQILFGRDAEIEELQWRLVADRIIVLYSASGAGKTSLLTAKNGLLAQLRQRFLALPILRTGGKTGMSPVQAIIGQLESSGFGMTQAGDTLPAYFERIEIPAAEKPRRLLLVIDQFEELFSNGTSLVEQQDFFRQLGQLLARERKPIWAIISMREEYFSWLDPYRDQVPTRLANTFRLNLLTRKQAAAAVRGPALALDVIFPSENGSDAADFLVSELSKVMVREANGSIESRESDRVEAVQLQVICMDLWNRLSEKGQRITAIRHADVLSFNVQTALQTYCDNALNQAATQPDRTAALRDWIDDELLTPSGLRAPAMLDPADRNNPTPAEIGALEQAHLIRRQSREDGAWYELSHDSLAIPVRRSIEQWRVKHLDAWKQLARGWNLGGEPSNYFKTLPQGARKLIPERADGDTPLETRFLKAYRGYLRHRRTVRSAMALFAVVTVLFAVSYAERIKKETTLIAERNDTALQAGVLAILGDTPSIGLGARAAVAGVELQDKNANAVALNFRSLLSTYLNQTRNIEHVESEGTGELQMLALNRDYRAVAKLGDDAYAVEIMDPAGSRPVWKIDAGALKKAHQYGVFNVALLDNGKVATGGGDGDIQIWDIRTKQPDGPPLPARSGSNGALMSGQVRAFASTGDVLYVGYENRGVAAWPLRASRGATARPSWNATMDATMSDVAISDDGRVLALADLSNNEHITLMHFTGAQPTKTTLAAPARTGNADGGYFSVAISTDGTRAAAGNRSGSIDIWDIATKETVRFQAHDQTVAQLKYLKSGALVSIGWDGRLKIWTASPDKLAPPTGRTVLELKQQLVNMVVKPDERSVVVTTGKGGVLTVGLSDNVHPFGHFQPGFASFAYLTGVKDSSRLMIVERELFRWARLDGKSGIPAGVSRVPVGDIAGTARAESIGTTFVAQDKRVIAIPDKHSTAAPVSVIPEHGEKITSIQVNHTGTILVVMTERRTSVWSLERPGMRAQECKIAGFPAKTRGAAFRPAASDFVTVAAQGGTLQLWKVTENAGACPAIQDDTQRLDKRMSGVETVAFHPGGDRLLASDFTGRTFERRLDGKPADNEEPVAASLSRPTAIAVSANDTIAMGDSLGGISIRQPSAKLPMKIAQDFHQSRITSLAMSDDGNWLVSTSNAGTAIWDLRIKKWITRACALARNRSFDEQDQETYFGRVSEKPTPCPTLNREQ